MSAEPAEVKRIPCGIRFGAAQAVALAEHKGCTIIRVQSDRGHKVDIRVTKTGQMRVYFNGLECLTTKGTT
jgi:hypothetical protein